MSSPGGLAEGLGILEEHLDELDIKRLVAHAKRYGKASVAKRKRTLGPFVLSLPAVEEVLAGTRQRLETILRLR